jgi:S-DNA-T family DNA segregation ATPase FtsK/SpoIIIE
MMLGGYGLLIVTLACAAWASLATWSVHDPSLNNATRAAPRNLLGSWGAVVADLTIQSLGIASIILFLPLAAWGWHLVFRTTPNRRRLRFLAWPASVILLAAALAALPQPKSWPLPNGLGGIFGDFFMAGAHVIGPFLPDAAVAFVAGLAFLVIGTMLAIGSAALDLALQLRSQLWPEAPVIFTAVDAGIGDLDIAEFEKRVMFLELLS